MAIDLAGFDIAGAARVIGRIAQVLDTVRAAGMPVDLPAERLPSEDYAFCLGKGVDAHLDLGAIAWLAEQGTKDKVNTDISVRQLVQPLMKCREGVTASAGTHS